MLFSNIDSDSAELTKRHHVKKLFDDTVTVKHFYFEAVTFVASYMKF